MLMVRHPFFLLSLTLLTVHAEQVRCGSEYLLVLNQSFQC